MAQQQDDSNVLQFPGSKQVTSEQIANAAELKPEMNAVAGAVWDKLAPEMMALGRLKPHFINAFAEYCYLLAKISDTRKYLSDNNETYEITGRNGPQIKSRPQVAQLNDDWRKLSRLTGCFGLTPSDEKTLVTSIQGSLLDEFGEFK